ncbi:MAG: MetQ/NlpA family ABC transporter substrate-binding protein [Defluviitaleaceae bacterium]|nr:MetQ/NlpA family ABC transporter substrate-binding protein [Defluviitaleaceae bacterium]
MKKFLTAVLVLGLALLAGCNRGGSDGVLQFPSDGSPVRVYMGASPTPHRMILEYIMPALRADGIDLVITDFIDFNVPNVALTDGDIHANYFQHIPFLNVYMERTGNRLHVIGPVHVEPIGAYSLTLDDIMDIPEGGTVAMPQDPANTGRALMLLQQAGLIQLDPNIGIDPIAGVLATPDDVISNPRNLRFIPLEAPMVARALMNNDAHVSIVNTNVLLDGTPLCPINDSLIREAVFGNPYANVLVVREENADSEVIATLYRHLTSEAVRAFIQRTFTGVDPVF